MTTPIQAKAAKMSDKEANAKALFDLGTATVSDALDRLGIHAACLGIAPTTAADSMFGFAVTVRYGPAGTKVGTVGDYIDDVPAGSVVVLDNAGRMDCTVWGDILTEYAHSHGIAGALIDGVCRDTTQAAQLGFPVFARGRYMRTGKDRVQVEEVGGSVAIGGVRVAPSDLVIADRDGALIVPAEAIADVRAVAEEIGTVEDQIRAEIRAGTPLRAARASNGYHSLQTRVTKAKGAS